MDIQDRSDAMTNTITAVATKTPRGGENMRMAARTAARMVEELDANKDGQVDKREFVAAMTAKGMSEQDAIKQFDSIDTQKASRISKADIEQAIRERRFKPPAVERAPAARSPVDQPVPETPPATVQHAASETLGNNVDEMV
jgi:Ca2+-binding EF-hand superfamily protein